MTGEKQSERSACPHCSHAACDQEPSEYFAGGTERRTEPAGMIPNGVPVNETVINPQRELGKLTDASGDAWSNKIMLNLNWF